MCVCACSVCKGICHFWRAACCALNSYTNVTLFIHSAQHYQLFTDAFYLAALRLHKASTLDFHDGVDDFMLASQFGIAVHDA